MRFLSFSLVILAVVLLAPFQAAADMPRLELTLRGWYSDFDGETSVLKKLSTDNLDLDDALGFDDFTAPEARLRLRTGEKHAIELRYAYLEFDSSEYLARPFVFDGRLAGVLNRVEGDIALHYIRLGWRYRLIGTEDEKFQLDTMLDLAVFNGNADYKLYEWWNPWWVNDESDYEGWAGLPLLGVSAKLRPMDRFEIFGELSGMYAGDYGHAIDAEAGLRFIFTDAFSVEAGYRLFKLHGEWDDDDDDMDWRDWGDFVFSPGSFVRNRVVKRFYGGDDEADLQMSGPFVGATLRF